MTKIEEFVSYAAKLPPQRLDEVETILAAIMEADEKSTSLSPAQEKEIARRLAISNPSYAPLEDVEAIFGKPFRK